MFTRKVPFTVLQRIWHENMFLRDIEEAVKSNLKSDGRLCTRTKIGWSSMYKVHVKASFSEQIRNELQCCPTERFQVTYIGNFILCWADVLCFLYWLLIHQPHCQRLHILIFNLNTVIRTMHMSDKQVRRLTCLKKRCLTTLKIPCVTFLQTFERKVT